MPDLNKKLLNKSITILIFTTFFFFFAFFFFGWGRWGGDCRKVKAKKISTSLLLLLSIDMLKKSANTFLENNKYDKT